MCAMYMVYRRVNTAVSPRIGFLINKQRLISVSLAFKQRYFIPDGHQTSLRFTVPNSDIDVRTFSVSVGEQNISIHRTPFK
jgi:hypothetical protein